MLPILSILLFLFGTILGAAANFLIYRQRIRPRPISPWMRVDPNAPPRRWFDRIPVFGWLSLRREATIHGAGFWIRPLLVELLMGIGAAALYQYEIQGGLLPAAFPRPFNAAMLLMLHCQYFAHIVLIFLMIVASLIDADETIIPDSITVTGTLLGLLLATFCPLSLLPDVIPNPAVVGKFDVLNLNLCSPLDWPAWLSFPSSDGLFIGLGCWLLWCFALLPRTWYPRHGMLRALRLCMARVRREFVSLLILLMAIIGAVAITACWSVNGPNWEGLLTALVGMAAGGGIVWVVRIVGSVAMRVEAMGFGDVTLMAMIGAFVGWQPCFIIFFLAPFAALAVGLLRLILFRQREIPYGPFLCLATLACLLCWDAMWERTQGIFSLGWIMPVIVLVICCVLMPILLFGMRILFRR